MGCSGELILLEIIPSWIFGCGANWVRLGRFGALVGFGWAWLEIWLGFRFGCMGDLVGLGGTFGGVGSMVG